jgi:hypothetical protein
MTEASEAPTPEQLRQRLWELVEKDILGPASGPEEELPRSVASRVTERYLVGMLAPRRRASDLDPATDEELAEDGRTGSEDGATEPSRAPRESTLPSSLGLTFCVASGAKALRVTARWGRYERCESATLKDQKTGSPERVWKRTPVEGTLACVPLKDGPIAARAPVPGQPEVVIQGLCRRRDEGWIVTLFLVNGQE